MPPSHCLTSTSQTPDHQETTCLYPSHSSVFKALTQGSYSPTWATWTRPRANDKGEVHTVGGQSELEYAPLWLHNPTDGVEQAMWAVCRRGSVCVWLYKPPALPSHCCLSLLLRSPLASLVSARPVCWCFTFL